MSLSCRHPFQCRRCGAHTNARSLTDAAALLRSTCINADPPHDPIPRLETSCCRTREDADLDSYGLVMA